MDSEVPSDGAHSAWKRFGLRLFNRAMEDNLDQIRRLVLRTHAVQGRIRLLDLGCGDGRNTLRYMPSGLRCFGVESSHPAAIQARSAGVQVARSDLNRSFPWKTGSFDVITSNQVLEHLHDTDTFLAESYRLLRPGGHVIVSTENLASWHNIFALMLGWQAFSLTNVSQCASGVGNPLANMRGSAPFERGWEHMRIFSYRGLLELLSAHGFRAVKVVGAGYYPLPATMARVDPRHAAFITVSGKRP